MAERKAAGTNSDMAINFNLANYAEMINYAAPKAATYTYVPPKVTVDYQNKFDPAKAPIYVPTKTVVVTQDPPAGQVVPAGTEIKVTLINKSTLPVGSFQVAPSFLDKYGTAEVGIVLKDLEEKGQAVKPILATEKAYEALSQPEKAAFTQYVSSIGLPAANEVETKGLYEDYQFFLNF
jgi:hypothetical protein